MQRSALLDREKQFRLQSTRGSLLLEQERKRNFEKQREELAGVQKLQSQLKAEQQRWERDRDRRQREMEAAEAWLHEREEEARRLCERLGQEREELDRHREAYQRDLERLREAQRAVEKERERLEHLRWFKKQHTLSTIPAATTSGAFSPEMGQAHALSHSVSFNGEGPEGSIPLPPLLLAKPGGRTSVSRMDYLERAEPGRRDSAALEQGVRPVLGLKNEVPIHLLSATNQIQKQAAIQQQIPTKLATFTKGCKEKAGGSGKGMRGASHRTDSSASVDMRQLFPPRMASKEDPLSQSRHSTSPVFPHSQNVAFLSEPTGTPESSHPTVPSLQTPPPTSANLFKPNSVHALPPALDDATKEDVIFF
ncbi:rho guanine nucleotide exchange factor 18-like isoform X2 [Sceloporus undulatus]|uniref:rho guanine nucleotide exchange factor 18-like isoform X2 n=1 Tax=Sceloporus undulatus TaxID=8520 RepID=UPI001C4B681B|nr:rho guanine nucleotide exchange factor 18-like isoform X2 [Sceloporus undulatus]